jgi:GTP-binding protein
LLKKEQVIIATKIDEPEGKERLETLRVSMPDHTILGLSNITGEGLDQVKQAFIRMVNSSEKPVDDGFSSIVNTEAEYREEP